MREFERYEAFDAKCPVCGARNKVYTEMVDTYTNKHIGFTLKCCFCGKFTEFYNEHSTNGGPITPNMRSRKSNVQYCVQHAFCPFKDCKLYGKNVLDLNKMPKGEVPPFNHDKDDKDKYPFSQAQISLDKELTPRFL